MMYTWTVGPMMRFLWLLATGLLLSFFWTVLGGRPTPPLAWAGLVSLSTAAVALLDRLREDGKHPARVLTLFGKSLALPRSTCVSILYGCYAALFALLHLFFGAL